MMKTVRFSKVVEQCGRPEPYTLWTAPRDDREFQRALKASRVMTVHQETVGAKKDFGEVGFGELGRGNLLVFPKSLNPFKGMRVVGVKYDLLKAPEKSASAGAGSAAQPKAPAEKSVQKAKPTSPPVFRVLKAVEPPAPPPTRTAKPPPPAKPPAPLKATPARAKKPDHPTPDFDQLAKAVRRAMKELQSGKAVAAYQTLEKALDTSGCRP